MDYEKLEKMITAEEILSKIMNSYNDEMQWSMEYTDHSEKMLLCLNGCVILPREAEEYLDSLHQQDLQEAIRDGLENGLYLDVAEELLRRVQKEVFDEKST